MKHDDERQRLLRRDAEWAALASEGRDVERIVSFWTDDAVVFPPGLPAFRGKEAIRGYVRSALEIPGFHITWSSPDATVSPDGRMGYMVSANAVTIPGPEGHPVTSRGRVVTVWRRDADGEWRCMVDIWNEEPAGS